MPKKYIDEDGNDVELLTPEEQQAEIEKKAAELAGSKKVEEKVEEKKDEPKIPTLDEINKILEPIKKATDDLTSDWFNSNVGNFIDEKNEEEKKQVDYWFNLLKSQGVKKEEALENAIMLVTKKPLTPLNGVMGYNKTSGVPKSKTDEGEMGEIKKIFNQFPTPRWLQKSMNNK